MWLFVAWTVGLEGGIVLLEIMQQLRNLQEETIRKSSDWNEKHLLFAKYTAVYQSTVDSLRNQDGWR